MSARTSSGSWSGGGGGAPPDIIDLDKFMRSAVRPARPEKYDVACDELVVDAGGVDRKPGVVPLATAGAPGPLARSAPRTPAPPAPPALSVPSSSSVCSGSRAPPPHAKRYSHDSGLSDGSYARRKHRPHRRAPAGDTGIARAPRTPAGSSNSLRAFRAVCERALLDQQAQIARVAQLCERLTERPPPAPAPAPAAPAAPGAAPAPRRRSDRSLHSPSADTSDVSSSSRSTRDQRRKDKHRTEECKTYKIIMNKLDELNRLFAARARSPAAAAARSPAGARAPRRPAPSSGSVSVSDKLVATEPEPRAALQVHHNTVSVRGGSVGGAEGGAAGGSLRLTNTCALDGLPRHDYVVDSVAQWECRGGSGSSGGDPRCGFDLEDPVHLYSQAKRLQALPATMRRARSVEAGGGGARRAAAAAEGGERSLCALCRGYWRALTNFLAAQLFCYPDTA